MTANLPARQPRPAPANIIPFPGAMPVTIADAQAALDTAEHVIAATKAYLAALAAIPTRSDPCTAPGCNADLAAMPGWQRRQHMASHSLWRQIWAELTARPKGELSR